VNNSLSVNPNKVTDDTLDKITSVSIRVLNDSDKNTWINFLDQLGKSNPSVLGYYYPFYRDLLTHIGVGEPLYLGAFVNNDLVGLLPGFLKRSDLGITYCSLPFFGPNAGVVCRNDNSTGVIHSKLIAYVIEFMEKYEGSVSASFYTPFLFDNFSYYDSLINNAVVVNKCTQYLDLSKSNSNKKITYDIRKSQKEGVVISEKVTEFKIDTLYALYGQNCEEYQIPIKPKPGVKFLLTEGIKTGKVKVYFAYHKDIMIGGLIMLWGPSTASYYLPCTLNSARHLQPNTLLIDHAINDAKKNGITYWNWESSPSTESGVFAFKKKWGSVQSEYRIYIKNFMDKEKIKKLGSDQIADNFPYFYVYPFNLC